MDPEDQRLTDQIREQADQLEGEIAKGHEAARLLEHPLIAGAMKAIDDRWSAAWRDSGPGQIEEREKAYLVLRGLDEFRSELTAYVEGGKLAAAMTTDRSTHEGVDGSTE
jgi:hypothetical protein